MAHVHPPHHNALIDGLRRLWSEIAARQDAALASTAACAALADPLGELAESAGYPIIAGLLRDLLTGWRSMPQTNLSVDQSIDLAAWCDALVIGLEEGLDSDGVELLLSLHDGGGVDAKALRAELDPARPRHPVAPVEAIELPSTAAAPSSVRDPQPEAPSAGEPQDLAGASSPVSSGGRTIDDTPNPVAQARQLLLQQGIDIAELSDQELLDLACVFAADAPAGLDPDVCADDPVDHDHEVPPEYAPADTGPVAAARQLLRDQGVDMAGLSDQELLDLACVFAATEPAADSGMALESAGADPVEAARSLLRAQGVDIADLSDQELLELASVLQVEPTTPETPVEELMLGGEEAAAQDETATAAGHGQMLWIAEEELALTRAAITDQVMPGVLQLVEAGDAEAERHVRGELGYQLGLIANALQLFGIGSLDLLLRGMADGTLDRRLDGESLMRLSAALLGFLDRADPESAAFLAIEGRDCGLLDDDAVARFDAEAARIRIGIDPALIAARKRSVEPGDLDLRPAQDVLPDVLSSMLRELPGNASRLGAAVRALVERGDPGPMDEARRVAHTLKGDANTVGVRGLANLTHALEDSFIELLKAPERLSRALGEFLLEAADVVEECADHLLGRGPAPGSLGSLYQQALDWSNRLLEGLDSHEAAPESPSPDASATDVADATAPAAEAPGDTPSTLAVDTRLLDELQRLAGELTILSRQVEQRLDGLLAIERELRTELSAERNLTAQLDDLVALRGAALQSTALSSNPVVDALELDQYNELHTVSRRLSETHSDNEELVRRYARLLRDLEPLRAEQSRLNEDLQRTVARTRTLPFGDISGRLQRVVRQTARQVGKNVEVHVDGESTAIDAELLERLVEPLSHLLRNAIDHGIEISELRRAANKPERGSLRILARTEADRAVIEVADDGRGLDLRAIRNKAVQLGMIEADDPLDADELAQLILAPGFSTRDTVSQVSGRGVGLDVVNQRIQELRGSLSIHTEAGRGTRFSLRLPLSRSQANVVVAEGHGVTLAVVAAAIRRIVQINAEDIRLDERQALQVEVDGLRYPAQPIEALFDRQEQLSLPGDRPTLGLVIDMPGRTPQMLCVRGVGEITRAVVKPTSPHLPPIPAVRGITQLGDGRLAPVVDVDVLLQRRQQGPTWQMPAGSLLSALPRVVIADDSLSVRRALEQLMQDAGYEVAGARDGLEALQLIRERAPVAVLLDLEMPRMNGLEVCRHLRSDQSTRDTPVVMITSRASDKYRLMAEEAGVTRLLGKPFAEDELVTLIRDLVAEAAARTDTLFA